MTSSIGDPEAKGRGELLRIQRIMDRTGFAEGTVRSKYHAGTFEPVWKLGRHLVAWEADLDAWLDEAKARTTKRPQLRTDDLVALEAMLAEIPDLAAFRRLVVREEVIRQGMADTGESRQTLVDMIGAADSMDQEAVLALTDGAPTTLRDALATYADELSKRDDTETASVSQVFNDVTALLEFPYPGELRLELDDEEDETLTIRVNGRDLFTANHDEHGHAGMAAAREAAQAVFDAVAP